MTDLSRRHFLRKLSIVPMAGIALGLAVSERDGAFSAKVLRDNCANAHARIRQEVTAMIEEGQFAARNMATLLRDISCPCCGRPLLDWA